MLQKFASHQERTKFGVNSVTGAAVETSLIIKHFKCCYCKKSGYHKSKFKKRKADLNKRNKENGNFYSETELVRVLQRC